MLYFNRMSEEKAKNLWENLRILSFEQQPKVIQKVLLQLTKQLDFIVTMLNKKDELN